MLAVWLFLPLVVASLVAVSAAVRGAGREAARLGTELTELRRLQPALVELRSDAARVARAARQLHR